MAGFYPVMTGDQLQDLLVPMVGRYPALDSTQWFLLSKQPVQFRATRAAFLALQGPMLDLRTSDLCETTCCPEETQAP